MTSLIPSLRPRRHRLAISLLAALSFLPGLLLTAGATTGHRGSRPSMVYLESNRAEDNSILAFRRDTRGRLHPAGEYPTGGRGVFDLSLDLGPFDSDQNVIVNPEGTLLFAVNSGSDTVAVFHIRPDGSLEPVTGSPFPSGGANPVSVGFARDTLVVVNKAMDPARPAAGEAGYASFRVAPDGTLSGPLSTVAAPAGSSPSQAGLSAGRRLVFDAQFMGGQLQSFQLEPTGELTAADTEAVPPPPSAGAMAPAPLGLWAHPHHPILYAAFPNVNLLGVYLFDSAGQLTFVETVPNRGEAICWLRTSCDGSRLYTSNTIDQTISVYDTRSPLEPREIQKLRLRGLGNPHQIELDPDGEFLYVVTQRAVPEIPLGRGNSLRVLRVHAPTGRVYEIAGLPLELPEGTRPQGVAVARILEP